MTRSTSTRVQPLKHDRGPDLSPRHLGGLQHRSPVRPDLWTLGGKGSNFRLGQGAQFYFQHDAHMLKNGRISMFDLTAPGRRS